MKKIILAFTLIATIGASTQAQAIGCLSGGAAGAVAGHYAGHHAVVGAVGGCIVGHEAHKRQVADRKSKERQRHEQLRDNDSED